MREIMVLGPIWSFSYIAALRFAQERGLESKIIPLETRHGIEGILRILSEDYRSGRFSRAALVPVYNTLEGRVKSAIAPGRGLLRFENLRVRAEFWMEIELCLASRSKNPKVVASHPSVLERCQTLLRNRSWSIETVESTARAAELASRNPEYAAICPREAAEHYGLEILEEDVSDRAEGWVDATRFLLVWHKDLEKPCGRDGTLTIFELKEDRPGALLEVLKPIADRMINIVHLESMPKGFPGRYVFWMDLEAHRNSLRDLGLLEELEVVCGDLRILGSYELYKK